jgi:hypothetical protein
MWQILKTELDYTKEGLMFAYAISTIFFIAAVYWKSWDIFSYMTNTTIVYFITLGIVGSEEDKELRTRYYALLPVLPQQLAIMDLLYVTLFQLGMVLLWLCMLLFKPESATIKTLWGMLSQNGLLLSVITIFIMHHHLGFFGERKYKRLNYGILLSLALLVAGLVYFGHINAVAKFLWRHYMSASGALISTLLWLGLAYLSVSIFVRRKSYLE